MTLVQLLASSLQVGAQHYTKSTHQIVESLVFLINSIQTLHPNTILFWKHDYFLDDMIHHLKSTYKQFIYIQTNEAKWTNIGQF